jgi:hypothetical protein
VAVVNVPHYEPWVVARWAFRSLADRAATHLSSVGDWDVLTQAIALDGLHFDLLAGARRTRIASAVEAAADELRSELRDAPEEIDRSFADALGVLSLRLSDLTAD